jgi:hypothetical protein
VQEERLQAVAIPVVAENEHRLLSFPNDPAKLGAPAAK